MKIKQILKYSLVSTALLGSYEVNAGWNPFAKKDVSPEEKMRKDAEVLFPNALAMKFGCTSKLAQPFNPTGLAKYLSEELKLVVNEKDMKKKQVAMQAVQRVMGYVQTLDKCALNPKDKNFNGVIASKFTPQPGQQDACAVPQGLSNPPHGVFGKFDVAQMYKTFLDSVYNLQDAKSLCSKVMATNKEVGKIQRVAELKKELGIPSGIQAKALYLGFSEGLTKPLTYAGAGQKLMELFNLDQQGFVQHFSILLKGVTAKGQATTNPKAVQNLAQGCKGEIGQVGIPLIQQLCQEALKTEGQNTNNSNVEQWKRDLGVPGNAASAFAHYKIFDTSLVKNWSQQGAAEKLLNWYQIDSKGAMQHLNMILKGVKGDGQKTLNPNSSKLVVEACNGEMNDRIQIQIPIMKDICTSARKTNATNDNNAEVAGYKKQLGIGFATNLMLKTCSPNFLGKLNPEIAGKWAAVDPAGAKEYMENLGKCFKGQSVKNPKMAHFIEEKCNAGLNTVPGAENLCNNASAKVNQYNDEASESLMKGMEGMVNEGTTEEQNPFAQTNTNAVNFGANGNSEEMSPLFTDDGGSMKDAFSNDSGFSDNGNTDDFGSFDGSNDTNFGSLDSQDTQPHEVDGNDFANQGDNSFSSNLNPNAQPFTPKNQNGFGGNNFQRSQSANFGGQNWGSEDDIQHAQSAAW